MKVTFLDFRKRSKAILKALEQNEEVTILHRGQMKGVIVPTVCSGKSGKGGQGGSGQHPAFGLWADYKAVNDLDVKVFRP